MKKSDFPNGKNKGLYSIWGHNHHGGTALLLVCTIFTVIADPVSFNIIGKDTWQSSNFRSNRDLSSAAVDGCKIFTLSANCCTHTHRDSGHGWWSVDLQQTVILNSVTVFNRDSSRKYF